MTAIEDGADAIIALEDCAKLLCEGATDSWAGGLVETCEIMTLELVTALGVEEGKADVAKVEEIVVSGSDGVEVEQTDSVLMGSCKLSRSIVNPVEVQAKTR